jgi:atypical dual specificity phosphatase
MGVRHFKFALPGATIPNKTYLKQFCGLLNELEKSLNPNEYIGLHCTHGVNRTGYLLVYYLCKEKGISLDKALEAFEKSRVPHKVDK